MKLQVRDVPPRSVWALEQSGTHPLLARLYAARGVHEAQALQTDLKLLLPPSGLKGIAQAATLLADAIAQQHHLCIVADYDCDGATACAVALRGLRLLGAQHVSFIVPDRVVDGYGLTPEIAQRVHASGAQVLITVDNGIASVAGVQEAQGLGVQGVAAPSANLFGSVSPTTAAHVREAFPSLLVLDGGACDVGIESTIVDCSRGAPVLLRPGMLSLSQLSEAAGVAVLNSTSHEATSASSADALIEQAPAAPGSLASHYAPRARVRLLTAEQMLSRLPGLDVQVALWTRAVLDVPAAVRWVKMPLDAAQCAHELFAQLRTMDAEGVQEIWVETPPEGEAWDGVRDRLQRAAA